MYTSYGDSKTMTTVQAILFATAAWVSSLIINFLGDKINIYALPGLDVEHYVSAIVVYPALRKVYRAVRKIFNERIRPAIEVLTGQDVEIPALDGE